MEMEGKRVREKEKWGGKETVHAHEKERASERERASGRERESERARASEYVSALCVCVCTRARTPVCGQEPRRLGTRHVSHMHTSHMHTSLFTYTHM